LAPEEFSRIYEVDEFTRGFDASGEFTELSRQERELKQ
jgi:hypothetical protein